MVNRFSLHLIPLRGKDDGVVAIEFALIAPVFLALVFGIMIYGIYFTTWIAVTEAASEGARASVAGVTTAERVTFAQNQVNAVIGAYAPMLSAGQATVVPQVAPGNPLLFQVTVSYNFAKFGFSTLAALLPIPVTNPSITVTVSNGGY